MCKTHKIAKELEVEILKHLKGAEVLDVPDEGELTEGSYLVERDGEKFVLKTGGFDEHEVDDNWDLADMGLRNRMVYETVPNEYILYEYIDSPVLATKEFWTEENLQKVWEFHHKLAEGLREREITDSDVEEGVKWVEEKPMGKWLEEIADKVYPPEKIQEIRSTLNKYREQWSSKDGLAWMYKDNNADRYIDTGTEIVMVHRGRHLRPKQYMDMRYLAWVILKMPYELLTLAWVKDKVHGLGNEPARYLTFLMSLIGILWDMHGSRDQEGEFRDKTEKVKEIVEWVMGELNK